VLFATRSKEYRGSRGERESLAAAADSRRGRMQGQRGEKKQPTARGGDKRETVGETSPSPSDSERRRKRGKKDGTAGEEERKRGFGGGKKGRENDACVCACATGGEGGKRAERSKAEPCDTHGRSDARYKRCRAEVPRGMHRDRRVAHPRVQRRGGERAQARRYDEETRSGSDGERDKR